MILISLDVLILCAVVVVIFEFVLFICKKRALQVYIQVTVNGRWMNCLETMVYRNQKTGSRIGIPSYLPHFGLIRTGIKKPLNSSQCTSYEDC